IRAAELLNSKDWGSSQQRVELLRWLAGYLKQFIEGPRLFNDYAGLGAALGIVESSQLAGDNDVVTSCDAVRLELQRLIAIADDMGELRVFGECIGSCDEVGASGSVDELRGILEREVHRCARVLIDDVGDPEDLAYTRHCLDELMNDARIDTWDLVHEIDDILEDHRLDDDGLIDGGSWCDIREEFTDIDIQNLFDSL
ncbi:MAG: hypothetical protein ACF8QF_11935, partial [Phycisphaerales bacterium]